MIEPLASDVLASLLDASLRAVAVVVALGLLQSVLLVKSSRAQHAVWTLATCAMLLMPALSRVAPPVAFMWPLPAATEAIATGPARVPALAPAQPPAVASSLQDRPPQRGAVPASAPALSSGAPGTPVPWPSILLALYACGLTFSLTRLAAGWYAAHRIVRGGRTVPDLGDGVAESHGVTVPVLIGVIRSTIVLPRDWRTWPRDTLAVVLAHERAHRRRWDPLAACVAHVNRCVFWFHPLAWWLERRLSALAEHACDDEAACAAGDRSRYAELLLDLAAAAERGGGRVVWMGVRVVGSGMFTRRIERLLHQPPDQGVSPRRLLLLLSACAVAACAVAACEREPAPLGENPESTAREANRAAAIARREAVKKMSRAEIAALEAGWKANPEDLDALRRILIYYAPDFSGKDPRDQRAVALARRPYIPWLIEHYPDYDDRTGWDASIFPTSRDPLPDPDGFAAARALWIRHASQPAVSARVLGNAAAFLDVHDKPLAEQMLLQAKRLDPSGPWSERLGDFYALVLLGVDSAMPLNVPRSTNPADAAAEYARGVRDRLDASTDAELLASASQRLLMHRVQQKSRPPGLTREQTGLTDSPPFDPAALGRQYLERAVQLDPGLVSARRALARQQARDPEQRSGMLRLVARAHETFMIAGDMHDYTGKEPEKGQQLYTRSRQDAEAALEMARRSPDDPNYGAAIYGGNVALAAHALRDGDRQGAVRLMQAAGRAPASRGFDLEIFGLDFRLTNYLLKAGERESVAAFLDRSADLRPSYAEQFRKDAADIRAGVMPVRYQAMVARERRE